MATKAKTAGDKVSEAAESVETVMKTTTDAFRANFDKAVKGYDQFLDYGKETVEAYAKSASVASKGAETLHNEIYSYSKQSIEDSIAAAKTVMSSKSAQEVIERQANFAKSAFESYVGEIGKLNELFVATSRQAFEPLQGRYQAWVSAVQSGRTL